MNYPLLVAIWVGFLAFGGYLLYALRAIRKRGRASGSWPTTEGIVVESKVDYRDDFYTAKVRYQYEVQAKNFEGDVITYAAITADHQTANAYVAKYCDGARVTVHYDPHRPSIAVLEPGITSETRWICVGLMIVLGLAAISLSFVTAGVLLR